MEPSIACLNCGVLFLYLFPPFVLSPSYFPAHEMRTHLVSPLSSLCSLFLSNCARWLCLCSIRVCFYRCYFPYIPKSRFLTLRTTTRTNGFYCWKRVIPFAVYVAPVCLCLLHCQPTYYLYIVNRNLNKWIKKAMFASFVCSFLLRRP